MPRSGVRVPFPAMVPKLSKYMGFGIFLYSDNSINNLLFYGKWWAYGGQGPKTAWILGLRAVLCCRACAQSASMSKILHIYGLHKI